MNPCGDAIPPPLGHAQNAFLWGVSRRWAASLTTLVLTAALVFHLAFCAQAVPPKYFDITNARLETASGKITAKLSITVDNVTGLYEMLKDGATVVLVVQSKLQRVRSFWANATLAEMDATSTLQHNPLTREFSLHMPGENQPMLDKNLDRLLTATWHKFSMPLGAMDLLDGDKDSEYQVSLTLSLQHAKSPPWLAKNFMLWSKDIVDPETIILPFSF